MSQASTQKLKILALHGYTQSADKFKDKSPLGRKFKKLADFVFVTAPFGVPLVDADINSNNAHENGLAEFKEPNIIEHTITDVPGAFTVKEEPVECTDYLTEHANSFAWFLRRPNKTNTGHYYRGLKECIQFIEKVFEEKGPFDGIYGFSQGACLVTLLCALQQKKLTKHIKFDFAIIACGYKFVFDEFYDEVLTIASLHIYGETDQQVAPERSQKLASCFEKPLIVSHSGGHFVPCKAEHKKEFEPFFIEQWSRKFEPKTT